MKEWGLGHEFQYRGVLDRAQKVDFLRNLNVLSAPGTYVETKGIYLLEAMAVGVPVVQPRHGSFPEMIGKTGGGILTEPGNIESIADAILALWKDPGMAEAMGRRGAAGVREHYSVANMANRTIEVFQGLTAARPVSASAPAA